MDLPKRHPRARLSLAILAGIAIGAFGGASPAAAAPDFQLTVTPRTVFLPPNGSVHLTIGATGIDGFSSPLTLTAMGLPTGVTASFSPNPLIPPGTSDLTLTAGPGLVVTDFNVNIAATGGGITHFALSEAGVLNFELKPVVVEPPPCQGSFEGTLTNSETGAPIANSSFRIGPAIGTTDASGHYGPFSWSPGDDQFEARNVTGYWAKRLPVTIVCGRSTRLDYALLPWHPATVFGKVVEGTPSPTDSTVVIPTTTPIAGIRILLEGDRASSAAPSAADGSYTTNVHFLGQDNTTLTNARIFTQEPEVAGYWPRSSHYPSPIPIGSLAPFENKHIDVALVRQCTGKISGTVTYGDTGLPAAGVNVHSGHAHASHNVLTNASGAYSIDTALLGYNNIPTDHDLSASVPLGHPRAYYYGSGPGKTHFDACGAVRVVNLVIPPIPMGHIEGHVYDDSGALVAGAPIGIDALGCRPCVHTQATSDANGYYRISDIPAPSQWPVRFFDHFDTPYWDSPSVVVSVQPGATTTHDVHIVKKRFASVNGTVRDAITGAPLPGVDVRELAEEGPFTATAGDGSYLLGPIRLSGPDNRPRSTSIGYDADGYWQHEEAITVEKNQPPYTRNVDLIPVCRGAVVTGVVRHATTGAPIPFARLVTDQGNVVDADENGNYRFENVDVGSKNSPTELEITARKAGFEDQTKTIEIFCGAKVAVGSAGTIVIEKATEPDGDTTAFSFTGELGPLVLADGQSHETAGLFPGTYDVAESPVVGWALRDVSCNDEPLEPTEDGLVSIDVGPGETIRCVFTNEQPGTIVVQKETNPDGDSTAFEFFGPDGEGFTLADGQSRTFAGLPPGSHSVSEQPAGAWDVASSTCDDDDSGSDPDVGLAEVLVNLAAGETVTCTFTNARVATGAIVIKKETDPDGNSTVFEFFGPEDDFSLADGESHTISDLRADAYNISELVPDGWALDSLDCDDDDSAADPDAPATAIVNLAADETVTCTFSNRKLAPETGTIIITKTTDPAGDPTSFPFSSEELGNFELVGGESQPFADLTPGIYAVAEGGVEGWALESATCDDGSAIDAIDVAADEIVTCTFANTKGGTLTVTKETAPADDPQDFAFTTTGDGLSAFSLDTNAADATLPASRSFALVPGAYSVTETLPVAGWAFTSVTCISTSGASTVPPPSTTSAAVSVTLAAGDQVTCTYRNSKVKPPDLAVTKTPSPGQVPETGGTVAFAVSVANAGDSATLTSLTDDVFGNLNGKGTCSLPQTLAAGGSYSCSFSSPVSGTVGVNHVNTVTAAATNAGGSDQASGSATVVITAAVKAPDLAVTKTPTPAEVPEPGGTVTFAIRVGNAGGSATLTSLTDDLFGNLNGKGTCSVPQNLAAGGSYSCSFSGQVSGVVGDNHVNTVTAAATNAGGSDHANGSATVVITAAGHRLPPECAGMKFKETIIGTPGNDVIRAANHGALIFGLGGDDRIGGGNAKDCIVGGDGKDILSGGDNGADVVLGGNGDDAIDGFNGPDSLFGGPGNDTIRGGNGPDSIDGGDGIDNCDGGASPDVIVNCETVASRTDRRM